MVIRFTEIVCPTGGEQPKVEFPEKSLRNALYRKGIDLWLMGIENNIDSSVKWNFNFILSNGMRTEYKVGKLHDYMMPPDLCRQTRKVQVDVPYGLGCVTSFIFYDCNNLALFSIGHLTQQVNVTILEIGADEMIIGIRANLYYGCPAIYTDFQFMVCDKNE